MIASGEAQGGRKTQHGLLETILTRGVFPKLVGYGGKNPEDKIYHLNHFKDTILWH